MRRVLVTGAGSLLAAAIVREFSQEADVQALDRAGLDVTDAAAVGRTVDGARPDLVINCAAYNDVDGAETDPMAALRVNGLAVRALADACRSAGAVLVHYSTDFVFDGESDRPYREEDPPNPRGVYAASKLLGEWFAQQHERSYVLRVESLFGEPGAGRTRPGSLGTIVARIQAGEVTPVFVDRTVSPAYTTDVASASRELVTRGAPFGIYHCVNSGAVSWKEIAEELARLLDRPLQMKAVTLDGLALPARRPKFSALSNAKLAATGIVMPLWQDAVLRHLQAVQGSGFRGSGFA